MSLIVDLVVDGIEQKVKCQQIGRRLWFKLNGVVYHVDVTELTESFGKKAGGKNTSPEQIRAPMPGRVTKIFVNEGESVKKSQALVVMEAMKMEYTLKCDLDGQVQKVIAKVGEQVPLGQLLLQLKSGE